MKHGSLFSGIGGFDLAAEWMGWDNMFHCEWNEFGQKVLKYYWPNALSYADITKTDFAIHAGKIDILTGGFPCQPYSSAGKRLGKEDDRHLWPEMLRAIREIQPTWVLGENVRGLTNWNGGLVFDEVQADLESEGYEVTPFLLPAVAVNAPHRRDRIWFVAYSNGTGFQETRPKQQTARIGQHGELYRTSANTSCNGQQFPKEFKKRFDMERERVSLNESDALHGTGVTPDTDCIRQSRSRGAERQICSKKDENWKASWNDTDGGWPTQPPVCNGNDGFSARLDGITLSKWRNESIKAGGNAIVPQVALQIFKAIKEYDHLRNT